MYHAVEADTFIPELEPKIWKIISKEDHFKDDKHAYDFSFVIYVKHGENE